MIREDYCSFEVAKLLKEKGFDEPCLQMWECGPDKKYLFRLQSSCYQNITEKDSCLAPTHQMAMKWLREIHNIFIEISVDEMLKDKGYQWALYDNNTKEIKPYAGWGDSYEQACETAIKYYLENLI